MLIRALVVLLLVLNLGVALWWGLRAPAPTPEPVVPAGIARLQLATEAQGSEVDVPPVSTRAGEVRVEADRCFGFGPFADAAAVEQAQLQLQSQLTVATVRRVFTGTPSSWQVQLPPLASKEEAQGVAKRLLAAGFTDYYVIADGDQANAISLGRFGGESSARAHAGNLVAAGFPARVVPLGAGPAEYWLAAGFAAGFDPVGAQALIGATQAEPIDCADLDPDPTPAPPARGQPTP